MLFPPTPRNDQRFVLLFFTGNGEWGKKKAGKGDLKEYFSRSFVIILGLEAIRIFMPPHKWPLDFTLSEKRKLLQHIASHELESVSISTQGKCTSADTRVSAVASPSAQLPLTPFPNWRAISKEQRWEIRESRQEKGKFSHHVTQPQNLGYPG